MHDEIHLVFKKNIIVFPMCRKINNFSIRHGSNRMRGVFCFFFYGENLNRYVSNDMQKLWDFFPFILRRPKKKIFLITIGETSSVSFYFRVINFRVHLLWRHTREESVGSKRHSVTVATSCVPAKAARSFSKSHLLGGLNLKTKTVKFDRHT